MLVWTWGCAGDLEDPERFDFILKDAGSDEPEAGRAGQTPSGGSGARSGTGGSTGSNGGGRGGTASTAGSGGTKPNAGAGGAGSGGSKAGAGGAGSGGSTDVEAAPDCVVAAFKAKCASAGCHNAGASAQVDLASDNVAGRLVGKGALNMSCKGKTIITTDGSASLLTQKLAATQDCGSQMPLGAPLTDPEKKCITDWVVDVSGNTNGGL
ncbi:MAG: hypothetical protein RL701_7934 [Pseudomonadota bacterium]